MITTLPMSKKNRGGVATSYGVMQRRFLPNYHGSQRKRIVLQYYFYGSIPYAKHKNN